jgi:hypothetical protein
MLKSGNCSHPVGGGAFKRTISIMKIQLSHKFKDIISLENLLSAWREFIVGKKKKKDVQIFSRDLLDNILSLHRDLANRAYQHGGLSTGNRNVLLGGI